MFAGCPPGALPARVLGLKSRSLQDLYLASSRRNPVLRKAGARSGRRRTPSPKEDGTLALWNYPEWPGRRYPGPGRRPGRQPWRRCP